MLSLVIFLIIGGVAAGLSQNPLGTKNLPAGSVEYYAPNANGGSELTNANDGLGEPLNVCEQHILSICKLG